MSEHMSEPEDELTPLSEPPARSALSRSPYIALGVAAVVVSTVFATVAALAGTREETAAPAPKSQDAVEITTTATPTADPTTTATRTSSSAPATSSTTTTTTEDDETTTTPDKTTTPKPPPRTTTPKPPTTTPPPENKAPTARFTFSCVELSCDFDGGGSSDPENGPLTYGWSCGGSSVTTTCEFDAAGDYQVTLTVTDNKNKTDTETKTVTVPPPTTTSGN